MNTTDAAKRVDLTGAPTSGRIWLAAILAALGTFILLWLLSPGLRSDLGQVADFLSKWDAAAVRDWILSFGSFSPVIYFLVVVAQVIVSPIPGGPVTFVAARVGRSSRARFIMRGTACLTWVCTSRFEGAYIWSGQQGPRDHVVRLERRLRRL